MSTKFLTSLYLFCILTLNLQAETSSKPTQDEKSIITKKIFNYLNLKQTRPRVKMIQFTKDYPAILGYVPIDEAPVIKFILDVRQFHDYELREKGAIVIVSFLYKLSENIKSDTAKKKLLQMTNSFLGKNNSPQKIVIQDDTIELGYVIKLPSSGEIPLEIINKKIISTALAWKDYYAVLRKEFGLPKVQGAYLIDNAKKKKAVNQ